MVLLENDSFLTELTRLFQKCRNSGSVVITLKKYDGRTKPVPRKGHSESFEPADNKCLIRASDGKKKISTVVSTKEVIKFQMVGFLLWRTPTSLELTWMDLRRKIRKAKARKPKPPNEQQTLSYLWYLVWHVPSEEAEEGRGGSTGLYPPMPLHLAPFS
ncbi:signal recognition particle 14 kDa protein isoform 1-T1 [Polymixia lowei]